jgi:hypothetical protein
MFGEQTGFLSYVIIKVGGMAEPKNEYTSCGGNLI